MKKTLENGMTIDMGPLEAAAEDLANLKKNMKALKESVDAQTGIVLDELEKAQRNKINTNGYVFERIDERVTKLKTTKYDV